MSFESLVHTPICTTRPTGGLSTGMLPPAVNVSSAVCAAGSREPVEMRICIVKM